MTDSRYQFHTVQRLQLRDPTLALVGMKGFDRFFRMDYMGSAEYEFGTPATALRRIRAEGDIVVRPRHLIHAGVGRDVHFVAPARNIDAKIAAFPAWLANPRTQEPSWFPEAFTGQLGEHRRVDAWWSFDDDIAWALTPVIAEQLVAAFTAVLVPA